MDYTIQKLARLAGVTTRTLRYYDEIGLLEPTRISTSGYRIYQEEEVNKLQEILFYREMAKRTALLLAPAWICAAVFLLFLVMGAYVFPMIAALDLPLKAVLKNAFLLVFLRFPQNLLLAMILGGITGVCFLFFPVSIPLVILLASSLQSLTGAAIVWPGIEQYVCGGAQ